MPQNPTVENPDTQEVLTAWAADIDTIIPDPNNARKHNHKNIQAIKGSLQRFGQRKPIVIGKDSVIQAGGGTYLAAKELGWKTILVMRSPLEGVEAAAYSIADNRAGELAEWNDETLITFLKSYQETEPEALEPLGWNADDLAVLLGSSEPEQKSKESKDESDKLKSQFQILIICADEQSQSGLLTRLSEEGFQCKALIS